MKICPTCDAGDPTSVIPYAECECEPTEINKCEPCITTDISGPGTFEGEPIETYHAYHLMLEGAQDEDNGPYWLVGATIAHESDQGHVTGDHYETDEQAKTLWESGIADICFDRECEHAHDEDSKHKPCQAPADGSPCDEPAQNEKRYCTFHIGQIDKLAQAGRLP